MSSEGVIKIKGDNTHLDKSTEKSVENMKQLGRHASQAHGHAKTFGQAWEHANGHMARTAIHAISIGGALHTAVHLLEEFQKQADEASKAVGDISLKTAAIAGRLGLDPDRVEQFTGGNSPVPKKERLSFAASLSDKETVGRTRRRVTEQEFAQANALFNTGLFDQKEIEHALDRGTLPALQAEDRMSKLRPQDLEELETRRQENAAAESVEDIHARNAQKGRRQQAAFDRSVAGTIFDHDYVRGLLGSSYRLQGLGDPDGDAGHQVFRSPGLQDQVGWSVLGKKLDEQTDLMHRDAGARPTVNAAR